VTGVQTCALPIFINHCDVTEKDMANAGRPGSAPES